MKLPRHVLSVLLAAGLLSSRASAESAFVDPDCVKPEWPRAALQQRQQGNVGMSLKIADDGRVTGARVGVSSAYPLLDEAARLGIMQCQFKVDLVKGKLPPTIQMTYVWTLEGEDLDSVRRAAQLGDTGAQATLGGWYRRGEGLPRDYAQAFSWLNNAARAGDPEAQYQLALMYGDGEGVDAYPQLAAALLRKAAAQGHGAAMWAIATDYRTGHNVERSPAEAVAWYKKAINADLPGAFYSLAMMYESGDGVARNHERALELLRGGVELNDYESTVALLNMLWESPSPKDRADALSLLRKSVQRLMPEAQALLGRAYLDGTGLEKNPALAVRWYRKAAAHNYAPAQYMLARLTEDGNGVDKDDAEAWYLYTKAAQGGDQQAIRRLLELGEHGGLGQPPDTEAAAMWRARLDGSNL